MGTEQTIIERIDAVLASLRSPISAEDDENGWTEGSIETAIDYFSRLRTSVKNSNPLPPLGIVRGLDHWGGTGGNLLIEIARLTNDLRP